MNEFSFREVSCCSRSILFNRRVIVKILTHYIFANVIFFLIINNYEKVTRLSYALNGA